jgi:hypothetical protein
MVEGLQAGIREAASHDPRAVRILAKTLYRELRHGGLDEQGVMALAGELLGLLASDVKDRREQVARPSDVRPSDVRPSDIPPSSGTWVAGAALERGDAGASDALLRWGFWAACAGPERED